MSLRLYYRLTADKRKIKDAYILYNADPNFSVGTRLNLKYFCEYVYACLIELNPQGIDPLKYLNFAKSDISFSLKLK